MNTYIRPNLFINRHIDIQTKTRSMQRTQAPPAKRTGSRTCVSFIQLYRYQYVFMISTDDSTVLLAFKNMNAVSLLLFVFVRVLKSLHLNFSHETDTDVQFSKSTID